MQESSRLAVLLIFGLANGFFHDAAMPQVSASSQETSTSLQKGDNSVASKLSTDALHPISSARQFQSNPSSADPHSPEFESNHEDSSSSSGPSNLDNEPTQENSSERSFSFKLSPDLIVSGRKSNDQTIKQEDKILKQEDKILPDENLPLEDLVLSSRRG